jgi:hypothetical protein
MYRQRWEVNIEIDLLKNWLGMREQVSCGSGKAARFFNAVMQLRVTQDASKLKGLSKVSSVSPHQGSS